MASSTEKVASGERERITKKPHIDYKKFWKNQISRLICDSLRARIRALERKLKGTNVHDLELHTYLEWRLGFNLFASGNYADAFPILERATTGGRYGKKQVESGLKKVFLIPNSDVHVAAARCAVRMFMNSKDRVYLQKAYAHYQNGVERMDLFVCIGRLAPLLYEFSQMLELYGAFDAAFEMQRRILEGLPYYRGYFQVMYRNSIVGKHLANITPEGEERKGFLTACVESLSFLLEAIPKSIPELHVKFLYARCVEASTETDTKDTKRAHKAFESFFSKCLEMDLAILPTDTHSTFDKWLARAGVWLQVADRFAQDEEPVLVEEALSMAIARCEELAPEGDQSAQEREGKDGKQRKKMGKDKDGNKDSKDKAREKELQNKRKLYDSAQHLAAYMKMARLELSFQNKAGATVFAEKAFEIEHCRADVRALLAECSEARRIWMENEDRVFKLMVAKWRQRFMTRQYIQRVKAAAVSELEQRFEKKRLDKKLRETLAYYGRDQYRPRFLFEHVCATRIQRMYRTKRFIWLFLNCVRANYRTLATEACVQLSKTPWNPKVRKEIRRIANHRLCPPEHRIKKTLLRIDRQDAAANVIRRAMKAYQIRLVIWTRVARTRARVERMTFLAARSIQCIIRLRRARKAVAMKRIRDGKELAAAIRIQRFYRWRHATFQHSVSRVVDILKREYEWAEDTLKYVLGYYILKRVKKERAIQKAIRDRIERERRRQQLREQLSWKSEMVARITRAIRRVVTKRTVKVAKRVMHAKKEEGRWSMLCKNIAFIEDSLTNISENNNHLIADDRYHSSPQWIHTIYQPPGISPASAQFINALNRKTTVCLSTFSSVDCMMFGNVLRHADCKIQQIVFVNTILDTEFSASFGFDLLPAMSRCRTLRSIRIFGGSWPALVLEKVFATVQVENARIQDFRIEGLDHLKSGALSDSLASAAGRLLCDYFNYTLPGLRSLCLHGCALKDHHLELISEGLAVNSSVTDVALSDNLITDEGLLALLKGITKNKSGALRRLNMECNFIRYRFAVRNALQAYSNPCNSNVDPTTKDLVPTVAFEVRLLNNPILLPFKLTNPEVVVCFTEAQVRRFRAKLKADEELMRDSLLHRPGALPVRRDEKAGSAHGSYLYCSEQYSAFLETPSAAATPTAAVKESHGILHSANRNAQTTWPGSAEKRVRLQGLHMSKLVKPTTTPIKSGTTGY